MVWAKDVQKNLQDMKNPQKAKVLSGFFKTKKGEYGEGDVFLGVTVPEVRRVAKSFGDLSFSEIQILLQSKIHEERMAAILILVHQFQSGEDAEKKKIYDAYLQSTKCINNWDLVDLSADKIVGQYMLQFGLDKKCLTNLAQSSFLWDRRIAMIATLAFIRVNQFDETFRLSKLLIRDPHDLMHKVVGWMLREAGKRDERLLRNFLDEYATRLSRTALRYAIERLVPEDRQYYLKLR